MIRKYLFRFPVFLLCFSASVCAQYPPAAGDSGTTAIYRDSTIIRGWATTCSIIRGYINLSDTTITYNGNNRASYGIPADGIGKADNLCVSLGDKGTATLTFQNPITNGDGFDFAIFENGFSNNFLELGFVEVSSDGTHFVRFPSVSLTPSILQISTFGTLDPIKIHNLAGKYRMDFGMPFDLSDIGDSLHIDIQRVTHVRIVDVGGCVQQSLASYDGLGNMINDPWPTPFYSCGFDLDGVGVIHFAPAAMDDTETTHRSVYAVFPIPCTDEITILSKEGQQIITIEIFDQAGRSLIHQTEVHVPSRVDVSALSTGYYYVEINQKNRIPHFIQIAKL